MYESLRRVCRINGAAVGESDCLQCSKTSLLTAHLLGKEYTWNVRRKVCNVKESSGT